MSADRPLDPSTVPLASHNLIEASAGTGKTFTIAALYLRLVVESGRTVDSILVLTYTVAATQELRGRIRNWLVQTRDVLDGVSSGDSTILAVLQHCPDTHETRRRLDDAIRGFDQAAIFTIHGFCQRVLGDQAFASGAEFDTALIMDETDLLQQVVDDFWRQRFYGPADRVMPWLVTRAVSPDKMLADVLPLLGKPYLAVIAPPAVPAPESVLDVYLTARERARGLWAEQEAEIRSLVQDNPALNKVRFRPRTVQIGLAAVDAWLRTGQTHAPPPDAMGKFDLASMELGTNKGQTVPSHPFFRAVGELLSSYRDWSETLECLYRHLLLSLRDWTTETLAERKRVLRLQSFDDLLIRLQAALRDSADDALAKAVRRQFRAALIDEFQDTDPIQYDIFRRIYSGIAEPVFLVGDPKQAIYGFRGADVFAYLQARREAVNRYALGANWRSGEPLVDAVNRLFSRVGNAFVVPEIAFSPVRAASTDAPQLRIDGEPVMSFEIWYLGLNEKGKPRASGPLQSRVIEASADEIARLLYLGRSGRARLGAAPLTAGDIAVLVRSNAQAREMQRALAERLVVSVQLGRDSVFHSLQALELERVLAAVLEPSRRDLVAAALGTVMLGHDATDIHALQHSEPGWDTIGDRFHELHLTWREHGFMRMFRVLLTGFRVRIKLLRHLGGQRRLTNLLHLAELLQARALTGRLGPERLLTWLAERRCAAVPAGDEAELRLDSDAELVRIVTVHKSKGLEYPVTFCPFLWTGLRDTRKDLALRYHDGGVCGQDTVDLRRPQALDAQRAAQNEALAEDMRLCYVALTRAKSKCYVVAARGPRYGTSALAWLFHRQRTEDGMLELTGRLESLDDTALLTELASLTEGSDISVEALQPRDPNRVSPDPAANSAQVLSARQPPGSIESAWRLMSFSSLLGGLSPDLPEHDLAETASTALSADGPIQSRFPRGAAAGTCLHSVFEGWDFHQIDPGDRDRTVETTLNRHGFDPGLGKGVGAWLQRVVDSPLDTQNGMCLSDLAPGQRVSELEFHYPVAADSLAGVSRLLQRQGAGTYRVADAGARLSGFMKGFIDLVFEFQGRFYLADYKSNWLGPTVGDYGPEALAREMDQAGYRLQYLIYSVALCRYLRLRLPSFSHDQHFGGAYYLFLRGMGRDGPVGHGVFFERPSAEIIGDLDAYLGGRPV